MLCQALLLLLQSLLLLSTLKLAYPHRNPERGEFTQRTLEYYSKKKSEGTLRGWDQTGRNPHHTSPKKRGLILAVAVLPWPAPTHDDAGTGTRARHTHTHTPTYCRVASRGPNSAAGVAVAVVYVAILSKVNVNVY